MSTNSSKPEYYKNEITEEDVKKLEEILDKMISDKNAFDFKEPVDYDTLGLYDYPKVIKHPMDLGTLKKNLLNGDYKIFQEFIDDANLIWENCRLYNQAGSGIVKKANNLDKKMRQLIDKHFKNAKPKVEPAKNKNLLSIADKTKLIDMIRQQSNEGLTQIVKIILKNCPEGIEDIDNDKLQIKIDFLTNKEFNLITEYVEKINAENNSQNSDNNNN